MPPAEVAAFLEREVGPLAEDGLVYLRDRETREFRGIVFVTFEVESDNERAIEVLDGFDFGGFKLRAEKARPPKA